jgi:hypothetical protein
MWTARVDFRLLRERGQWNVEYFREPEASEGGDGASGRGGASLPIRRLARERGRAVDPADFGDATVNYVGLEHVRPLSGEMVGFAPRSAREVKSRSKVFEAGDVLFGRLRPGLNKVWVATAPAAPGICSTEFFVLTPNREVVLPTVLRYLLSSHYVQRHALRLQTGTALPRMNLSDLLEIEVPVPPMAVQQRLETELTRRSAELVALRAHVETLPEIILRDFLVVAEGSDPA